MISPPVEGLDLYIARTNQLSYPFQLLYRLARMLF